MFRPDLETLSLDRIRSRQLDRVNQLLSAILPGNRFYAAKFGELTGPVDWPTFSTLPFTTKTELVRDQTETPPLGTIATFEERRYVAYHQTSGTTGRPLAILDTREGWDWWLDGWQYIYHGAGVTPEDRLFFAFSFGPFIGFWSAFAAAQRLGALTIPSGGLDTKARLQAIARTRATVLLCTPTYALRLAEVARSEGVDLRALGIRRTIHAGEPGASVPGVRDRIERAWGARCFDHPGSTEAGPFGYPCAEQAVHLNEAEFVVEILDPRSGAPAPDGEVGELVLTNLGRAGWPVIRYRTGDLVRVGSRACPCGRSFLTVPGGILGRADDLMIIRGVNVFPSALEALIREFDVDEFRIIRLRRLGMEELEIEVEATDDTAAALAERLRVALGIRVPTRAVAAESLPRWELKARRIVDRRDGEA